MRAPFIELQDIEDMRLRAGIDDVELRLAIRRLKVKDFVKLTLMKGASSFQTVVVQITAIRGSTFRGRLAQGRPGRTSLAFTTAHIHSILKKETSDDA
jgi:hypothetical protein